MMDFLNDYPSDRGVAIISAPQNFDGGEEAYDQHIGRAFDFAPGKGAISFARHHAKRPIVDVLEIGAGSGTCTLGMIASDGINCLVTDTSKTFLDIVEGKLTDAGLNGARRYATLSGEEVHRLPPQSFDAIIVASAVHHMDDWRKFISDCRALLRPGGVLAIQEPMREGYLLIAAIVTTMLAIGGDRLSGGDRAKLEAVRDSIYFFANSAIRKVGEDKHNFLADDLMNSGSDAGFEQVALVRNVHFSGLASLAPGSELARSHPMSLFGYLESFLRDHHHLSKEGLALLRREVEPAFSGLELLARQGDTPALVGLAAFQRAAD